MISKRQRAFLRAQTIRKWFWRIAGPILAVLIILLSCNDAHPIYEAWTWSAIFQATGLGDAPTSDAPCTVRVLDVGSADCIWIRCGDTSLLVDTGTAQGAALRAADLVRLGARPLNALILTHLHDDHAGAAAEMAEALHPQEVWVGAGTAQSAEWAALRPQFPEQCTVRAVSAGQMIRCGALTVEILYESDGDGNEASLVLRVWYESVRMMFMGDAEADTEQALLASGQDLSADWIKIGHHGSATSTTGDFLDAVSPRFAVISCGSAHPPSADVLQNLRSRRISYRRTDLDGAVLFATDGANCEMFTENS